MVSSLMLRHCLILSAMLLAAPLSLPAQTVGNWDAIRQFTANQTIRVSLADGRSFQGTFQSATDGELLLSTAIAQETLVRADVTKVATKGTNHRLRNAAIGLGVGAGAGLGVGAIVDRDSACKQPNGCLLNFPNLGKAVFTPVGAIVGLWRGDCERQLARRLSEVKGRRDYRHVSQEAEFSRQLDQFWSGPPICLRRIE